MLTLEKLKNMKPNTVFAKGIGMDGDMEIRWLAKRGAVHDWCIYFGHLIWPLSYIETNGDKFFTESKIKNLVPCNDEAFLWYRY